jgi:exopolysaccharide biosynthesis WecB/TagA/CpsF family protein
MVARPDRAVELVDHLSIYETDADVACFLQRLANLTSPTVLSFLNAHAVNLAKREDPFCENLLNSDILLRDGSGVATLCRWLGRPAGLNLNGTDLIPRIVDTFEGRTAALFGTCEPWITRAAARLRSRGLDVVHVQDGFQPLSVYRRLLRERPVKFVLLGMGMPRQERVAVELRRQQEIPCLIVNGGAVFDFLAGRFLRAPQFLRSLGMEWAYRLYREPRRLARRYVVGNLAFLAAAVKLSVASRVEQFGQLHIRP